MIEEARQITGLPERTLQSLAARGEIWGAGKLGRRWTFDRMSLRAWIKASVSATESRATSIKGLASGMRGSQLALGNIDDRLKRAIDAKRKGA